MSTSSTAAAKNTTPPQILPYATENLYEVYTLGRKLGQGQFGITYLCTHNSTGRTYACKSISKNKLWRHEDRDGVLREIQIMEHLSGNPKIVRIHGTYEDSSSVHVVMELCEGGELFDRIVEKGRYGERQAAKLFRNIVEVVEACHSLGIMHRDLKPENLLFDSVDEDAILKLIDFGLSVFFKPGETFSDVVGSPYYVAPEVLNKHYGPKADLWSAGIILYILLGGVPPYWAETEQGIFKQILQGTLDFQSEPWPAISDDAKDLIQKMLDRNPEKRFTTHQVLSHPWIAPNTPLDV